MQLQTKQLKDFGAVSKLITQNNILPILSYLKFDNGVVTKSNLESFVTMGIDFKGSCLIDEKILMSFVNSTSSETIDVEIKEKSIVLSVGKEKMISPTDALENFPAIMKVEGEEIELPNEIMNAIRTASLFTVERENMPFTSCVFVGNGIIAGSSGFVAYVKNVGDIELPEIIIEKETLGVVKNFSSCNFSQNETYQFYNNGVFNFGFVKKDTKYVNMTPFSIMPKGVKGVAIDKWDIVSFCDTCVNSCSGRVVTAQIKDGKLTMDDSAYSINYEKPLPVIIPDFTFNPALMGKLLKSIPDDNVVFTRSQAKYYITGIEYGDYVSLIMEMQLN